jgi:hypothetical protein
VMGRTQGNVAAASGCACALGLLRVVCRWSGRLLFETFQEI